MAWGIFNKIKKGFKKVFKFIKNKVIKHTHTVCVTYYKAAPYNISHT